MSDDIAAWLRSQVDDDETLSESDYDIMISARKARDAATEIARLRAALATAQREGMEEAATRLQELHKNHKYNRKTGEGSEHDVGYYRAIAEGVAHILRAAAKDTRIAELRSRAVTWAGIAGTLIAERDQLIGVLQIAVERSGDMEPRPAWVDGACNLLNQGFLKVERAAAGEGK